MDEHSDTPDEDWSEARYEAEVAERIAGEAYEWSCPDTCDELKKAWDEAKKELQAVIAAGI
jgi:Iap family predicted aminopeptidase